MTMTDPPITPRRGKHVWETELPDPAPPDRRVHPKAVERWANVVVIDCPVCGWEHRHGIHEDGSVGWRFPHCRPRQVEARGEWGIEYPSMPETFHSYYVEDVPKEITTLYRFYDDLGHLLYVGISSRLSHRLSAHRRTKADWSEVSDIKLEHFTTRAAALNAEREAIQAEGPLWNVVHSVAS